MLASGLSYRAVGMVLSGRHVHPNTRRRCAIALEMIGRADLLPTPPSSLPSMRIERTSTTTPKSTAAPTAHALRKLANGGRKAP